MCQSTLAQNIIQSLRTACICHKKKPSLFFYPFQLDLITGVPDKRNETRV